jgi:hypothetical protein
MSDAGVQRPGMTVRQAQRLEYAIIGIGLLALVLIFQPFSLRLFGVGCALVVVAGLMNNLLPLCEPGVPIASVLKAAAVVAGIFAVVLVIALTTAWAYGKFIVGT